MNNGLISLLYSLPVVLVITYFIPFLGICLLIFRYIMLSSNKKKRNETPVILIVISLIIFIPNILKSILKLVKVDINSIPLLKDILASDTYNVNFIKFAKYLLIIGIIFMILTAIFNKLFTSVFGSFNAMAKNYIRDQEERDAQIRKENDLKMQEKREIAKNSQVVKCPYCGGDNLFTSTTGTCKFCRRAISARKND